jgi:membrane-bound lytic murein transglycosylase D
VPIETTNYVPIILAFTIIMKNPESFGLKDLVMDEPLEYDTIEVYSPTSLQLAADAAGRSLPELEELNPAILRRLVPAGYFLRVPKGMGNIVNQRLNLVPANRRESWRLYSAQAGESVDSIARRYGLTLNALAEANPQLEDTLAAGGFVVIPQTLARSSAPKTVSKRSRAKASVTKKPASKKAPVKRPVTRKKR